MNQQEKKVILGIIRDLTFDKNSYEKGVLTKDALDDRFKNNMQNLNDLVSGTYFMKYGKLDEADKKELTQEERLIKKLILKLNTKFGQNELSDYLPISETRIRLVEDNSKFILTTNTSDNISKSIIESLGFRFIEQNDIIETRRLTFYY